MPARKTTWSEWLPWAYALICTPLVLLVIEAIRGVIHETQTVRTHTLQTELQVLRSQAMQRAKGVEMLIEAQVHSGRRLAEMASEPEFARYWSNIKLGDSHHLYAAVVDGRGTIILHTDPASVGTRLERGWYDQRVPAAGPDVTLTRRCPLAGNRPAYDVSVPLAPASNESGEYHEGLDAAWLDDHIAARQRAAIVRWTGVLVLVGVVDAAAGFALVYVARHQRGLQAAMRGKSRQRTREMAQLGSGLAHEIRNPLHALRINMHTLRRSFGGRSSLPEDQIVATIEESDGAISRLDELTRDLLQFSDPTEGQGAEVDLVHEVQATLRLLAQDFRREQITVREELPAGPVQITIDPARLRQCLLNLLTFAQHRAGKAGAIEVGVAAQGGGVELSIGDSGPALAEDQRKHMFEPFQSPVETGSGLGLALVQAYVEEVGGKVSWNGEGAAKSRSRLWFPLVHSAQKGGSL